MIHIFKTISRFQYTRRTPVFAFMIRKPTQNQNALSLPSNDDQQLSQIGNLKEMALKQFSVKVHKDLISKRGSDAFWAAVETQLMQRMELTTDPDKIWSFGKILYSLSRAKKATLNYETKMAILLPFARRQTFTMIVSSLSRIGPLSQQLCYIVEKLYIKRKNEFNPRELVTLNYTLVRNNRQLDVSIIQHLKKLNCGQVVTLLRTFDRSNNLDALLLERFFVRIRVIKEQINVLDLSDIVFTYFKHRFVNNELLDLVQYNFELLKRNVNEIAFMNIWEYLPDNLNQGSLNIALVQNVIARLITLRRKELFSQKNWARLQKSFQKIENLEIKTKLQKLA